MHAAEEDGKKGSSNEVEANINKIPDAKNTGP